MPVTQQIGACSATDISGYVAACDSMAATNTTCQNWFNTAPAACQTCLVGPTTGGDPGTPTGQGGIWIYQGGNIGANVPGCLDKQGQSGCATAYNALIECLVAAGCGTCTDNASETACQNTIFAAGGGCHSYIAPFQSACPATDNADGGILNGGACSDDTKVLSVLCGNGSGDGG
jgi:hypothetical protein